MEALAAVRNRETEDDIRRGYKMAIDVMNQESIDSADNLPQFADAITPSRRREAYEQMHQALGSEIPEAPAFDVEVGDFDGHVGRSRQ
jgi:hypothetical protein